MSKISANLDTLDKEDIYKQCLWFDEARFEDSLLKVDELTKDILGNFENWKVCSFNIIFLFCMYIQNKKV